MKREIDETGSFASELRNAIAERGVTLTWLHQRLHERGNPVAMATLSYWRSGARQPEAATSLAAVEDIEFLLGKQRGELTALVHPLPRIGPTPHTRIPYDEESIVRAIEETIQTLGSTPQSGLRDLSTLAVGHVDANGDLATVTLRSLVQATEATMYSIPLFDVPEAPVAATRVITSVIGGRFAPTYHHPAGSITCDLLELTEPVAAGDTALFEFTETVPPVRPDCRNLTHSTSRASKQTMLWVHFHPDAIPDWCEEFTDTASGEASQWRAVSTDSVHAYRFGFGPGTLGLRWGYDHD